MSAFLIWTGIILFCLGLYSLVLWHRSRHTGRLQPRLMILFFLFVLTPSVPLIFSLGLLLTKSTEMFMLPDIEMALSRSLEMMRDQMAARAKGFYRRHRDFTSLHSDDLAAEGIGYVGRIVWRRDGPEISDFVSGENGIVRTIDDFAPGDLQLIRSGQKSDAILSLHGSEYFEWYQSNGNTIRFIGFRLSDELAESRGYITRALRNYSSLSLLREAFIDQGLIWTGGILFVLFLSLVTVFAASRIAGSITRPIRVLTEGMRRIGAGDLSHRVRVKARDEMKFLVDSFNRMTEELKSSRERLQRAERAAAWRDVARQVSHEIKNPLTPIQFSLHRLKTKLTRSQLEDEDVRESFRIIEEEINSMRRMAGAFSEFARMPHLELHAENLAEIVRSSAKLFENAGGVALQLDIQEDLPRVLVDREQIRRVVHNLIKNAIEASKPGDVVHVRLVGTGEEKPAVKLEIVDQGCGMDKETLKKALKPYFTTKPDGSGLGLFIVNRIISDHGGRFEIRSEKGQGTVVTIYL